MKPVKVNPLARRFLSWSSRRFFKSEAFSCARKLKEAKKVLICMPASMDRFALAKEALSSFADIFIGKTIFVLLPFLKTDGYQSTPPGYEVIYPQKEELKIFSIPGDGFIQKVKEQQFDISLDLDLNAGFFDSYLCLKCGIPVRIGPRRKDAYPFYNIQLTVEDERSGGREAYEGMAKMLTNLFTGNSITKSTPL